MNKHRSHIEYGVVVEHNDAIAFHPGYYVMEIIEDSGLTQEDFARRLNTTPKNLSILVRGKERLSVDMALKLSNMFGTSVSYWLNLQNAYDTAIAEIEAEKELGEEIAILKSIGYAYFKKNFSLPDLPRNLAAQVKEVRRFLEVSSLKVLEKRDLTACYRSKLEATNSSAIAKANALVQIGMRETRRVDAPPYNPEMFKEAIGFALTQTKEHRDFLPRVQEAFLNAGVILVVLPNLAGSMTNGATKKVGSSVMLMVNDRNRYADTFWFTLMHEAGHIINGDYGLSIENERGPKENVANAFAQDALIPPSEYKEFIDQTIVNAGFSEDAIRSFAKHINRDPGIVVGRLMNDGYVPHSNMKLNGLRKQYRVCC